MMNEAVQLFEGQLSAVKVPIEKELAPGEVLVKVSENLCLLPYLSHQLRRVRLNEWYVNTCLPMVKSLQRFVTGF